MRPAPPRATAQQRQFRILRALDVEDDVGLAVNVGGASKRCAGGHELRVRDACVGAGARLDHHRVASARAQLLHRLGRRRHTCFARKNLGRDADAHRVEPPSRRIQLVARLLKPGPYSIRGFFHLHK